MDKTQQLAAIQKIMKPYLGGLPEFTEWLVTPEAVLSNTTPVEMIMLGEFENLLNYVNITVKAVK